MNNDLKTRSEFATGWSSCDDIVSDHRPVAIKIYPDLIGQQTELLDV